MLVRLQTFLKNARGSVAPVTALGLVALLGMGALAVDVARLFNLHTELQSAVDAAALSGATQLDGEAGAMTRARDAAKGVFVTNAQRFATDGMGLNVTIVDQDITFLQELATRTPATTDANANFIQVDVTPRSLTYLLAAIVGANPIANVSAHAVAGFGSALCKVPPLMICNPVEPAAFNVADYIGSGLFLKSGGSGSPWAPGNFGLLALDGVVLSTNEVRDAMGRVNPRAACFGEIVSTNPGQSTAVRQGFNMRFDIYEGPQASTLQTSPQYQPARNTVKGRIRVGTQCGTGGQGWREPANTYDGPLDADTPVADAMSLPKDDCAYVAPGGPGGCTPDVGVRIVSAAAGGGVSDVALQHYFSVNHGTTDWRGTMTLTATDPIPTRHEVYEWEKQTMNLDGDPATASNFLGPEAGDPVCYSGNDLSALPDRRTISTVVINCIADGVTGFTPDVTVIEEVDIFVLEPMGTQGSSNLLYVEVIGPTGPGTAVGAETRHTIIQLFE